ncbi:MAG: replication initiator protein A [Lachnospiraceae bacterium]|nr:replication initiator protein A [bacterium]MDY5517321.1 replication initiator protein A [Lachnospiraceae bacterium]
MSYTGEFDYFYGMESERYHFLIVPKLLMKDARFSHVSSEAKLMYGLLLDRNALSQKNGWLDEQNRVYIIYTIEEMRRDLGCATEKISKVLKELETIGLLYRKRNGRGKPNYLYVMDYMAIYRTKGAMVRGEDGKVKNFEKQNSRISISENQEFRKLKCNKTEYNKTDYNISAPKSGGRRTKAKFETAFHNFPQRAYDFAALEKALLSRSL